jgi:hypothetical protein
VCRDRGKDRCCHPEPGNQCKRLPVEGWLANVMNRERGMASRIGIAEALMAGMMGLCVAGWIHLVALWTSKIFLSLLHRFLRDLLY